MALLERIIKDAKELPTLPTVYSALCDAINNPRSTAEDVAKIISADQSSAIKILRIANSAFFGFSGRIETISRAVMVLGFNEVTSLVFSSSVMNLFSKKQPLLGFRPNDFWAHSIAVGLVTRRMGKALGRPNLENYFLAGILHDIGKLVFFEFAEDEFARVLRCVSEKGCSVREAELEILGMDHALMGSFLADHWKLPEAINHAIHYHHYGMIGEKPDLLVASVHVADIMARALSLGCSGDPFVPKPNEAVWDVLNWRPGRLKEMVTPLLHEYEETTAAMMIR
jgi:putative nucleotidyltransferase with HDIG domain